VPEKTKSVETATRWAPRAGRPPRRAGRVDVDRPRPGFVALGAVDVGPGRGVDHEVRGRGRDDLLDRTPVGQIGGQVDPRAGPAAEADDRRPGGGERRA
jgi:hypothetical protein